MSDAQKIAWENGKYTKERNQKISQTMKGKKPYQMTEEIKKKIGLSGIGKHTGEKSHFWKNGAMKNYPELKQERLTPEYISIMKMTKERDNYSCFWCGERGGELHSDHILPFIDYPRLRLEPSNIQTLCVNCHKIKTKGDRTGVYVFA